MSTPCLQSRRPVSVPHLMRGVGKLVRPPHLLDVAGLAVQRREGERASEALGLLPHHLQVLEEVARQGQHERPVLPALGR
ncbi:hypothetical protein, partial [Rhizobium sp. SEMIA 4085]|uniref:hypothetical protein n=1 Tax=Rhizobium sp. SEMIA 4085 TaxID=2137761 RepID=UPI001AED2555